MNRDFFGSGIAVVLLGPLSIAGNSQTASAQTVDSATMTVGHSSLYFGYSNGTSYGTFGSLSSTTLAGGYTVKLFVDVVNPFGLWAISGGTTTTALAHF